MRHALNEYKAKTRFFRELTVNNSGPLLTRFVRHKYGSLQYGELRVHRVAIRWRAEAMTERSTAKAKRREGAKTPPIPAASGGLGAENARLKSELAQARERIADLELRQAEIINRIDWVIDSLHNLAD